MSPLSQQKRKYNQRQKMHSTQVKLTKYQQTEITLDEQQDEEMENVMKVIEQQSSEKLFQEGEKHGVGDKLRQIWNNDKKEQKNTFDIDQSFNSKFRLQRQTSFVLFVGTGKRGNRWSMITIRMGMCVYWLYIVLINILLAVLAIFVRSPAAYEALKDWILQLPCRSTLQSYVGAFLHPPGASSVCLVDQVAQYVLFKEKMKSDGKLEPRSDGILVFDDGVKTNLELKKSTINWSCYDI